MSRFKWSACHLPGELGAMLEQLEVTTAARLREAEDELRFWLKELDPDADKRITEPEFEAALSRCCSAIIHTRCA